MGKWTYLDITSQAVRSDKPADVDQMTVYKPTPEQRRQRWAVDFSDFSLSKDPAMSAVKQVIDGKTDAAIQGFYDGSVSEEELSETFQALFKQFSDACKTNGYPIPLPGTDRYMEQAKMETFYGEFRRKLLSNAVHQSVEEGKQYVAGDPMAARSWKYYNSDYYYQSEAAISAISKGIMDIAQEKGYDDFSIPDYKAKGLNEYYNFNTAFSNNFAVSEQYILNPDAVPPRNFQWFFQTGANPDDGPQMITSITTEYPDGTTETVYLQKPPTKFDPKNPSTGITWAKLLGVDGKWHTVTADIIFKVDDCKDNLYNIGDLLKFSTGDPVQDAAVNQFFKSLQVYPRGHFERMSSKQGINLSV
ncbi:hypothetical protein D1159_17610 [Pseudoflavonifractor sp. 524-17]|nr:hypothetical protein [Pseudoflavonifractor sp. 524-17]